MNKLDYVIYYTGQNRSSPEADWISFRSFLQSNISILIAGNPMRSDNAWNEDHSENVYAQRSIVKLQAWDSVISIYCLCNTAVVFPLVLNTEVDVLFLSRSLHSCLFSEDFVSCNVHEVLQVIVPPIVHCALSVFVLINNTSHFYILHICVESVLLDWERWLTRKPQSHQLCYYTHRRPTGPLF